MIISFTYQILLVNTKTKLRPVNKTYLWREDDVCAAVDTSRAPPSISCPTAAKNVLRAQTAGPLILAMARDMDFIASINCAVTLREDPQSQPYKSYTK